MRVLVLGGTQWVGAAVATTAVDRGHDVTALARGHSGPAPAGVTFVRADRELPGAYDAVSGREWDAVIDVARQPGQVRGAVEALGSRAGHWVFVSSCSVYADHDEPGADESARLLTAHPGDVAAPESYGEGKVACEEAVLRARGPEGALIARAGLIGGPGDHSGRTGYWPLRFAHPATEDGSVLVPDTPDLGTQVIDVRDLSAWLVESAETRRCGILNAAGDVVPLAEHLETARSVAGHTGPLVTVSSQWLVEHGVEEWSGDRSLPLWLHSEGWEAFAARDASAARTAGLLLRPLAQTLADTLAWELRAGPGRPRRAGLSPADERELIGAARTAAPSP